MPQAETLNVSPEVVALGSAIGAIVADIKAGKTVIQDAEDAFTNLVGAVQSFDNIGTDIKAPDNIAYLVKSILGAVLPAVTQS